MSQRPGLSTALSLTRIGVGLIWWTALLALVAMAGFALIGPFVADESALVVTSEVRVNSIQTSTDGTVGGVDLRSNANPTLDEFSATLEYSPETRATWLLTVIPVGFVGLLWLFAIYQVRALLADVASDTVFTEVNARRIRGVGWALLTSALFMRPAAWFTTDAALKAFDLNGEGLIPVLDTDGWLVAILTGLLVLALGEVWRYGVEIERDRQLTV